MKLVSSGLAVAILLLVGSPLAAQGGVPAGARTVLVPQFGMAVRQSEPAGSLGTVMASILAEFPLHRAWSLTAEASTATGKYLHSACLNDHGEACLHPASIRSSVAAGVVVHPVRAERLFPYAGVAAGVGTWRQNDVTGTSPQVSLRAGLDVKVAGPFGARVELGRRFTWTGTPHASPMHTDIVSLGGRFAFRR